MKCSRQRKPLAREVKHDEEMRIRKNIRKFVLLATGCFLLSAAAISWTDAPVCGKAAKKIESVSIESGKQPQATQAMTTVHYPPQQPASLRPMLHWSKVDAAVAYQLEILQEAPEDPARFGVCGLHPEPAGKQRIAATINAQWKEATRRRL